MAIKVKHDGNATAQVVAAAEGGRARKAADTAKFFRSQPTQTTRGVTASAVSPGSPSAPVLSANAPTPTNWEMRRKELAHENELLSEREKKRAEMGFSHQKQLQKAQNDALLDRMNKQNEFQAKRDQQEREFQTQRDEAGRIARQEEIESQREWQLDTEQRALDVKSWEEEGFDAEQRAWISDMRRKRKSIERDKTLSESERVAALKEIDDAIAAEEPVNPPKSPQQEFDAGIVTDKKSGIRYRRDARGNWIPMEAPDSKPLSAKEIYESAYRDENGTLWTTDNKGGIVPLQNSTTSEAKPDVQRAKYISDRVAALTDVDSEKNKGGKLPTREEAEQIAMREYDLYSRVGAASAPTSTPAPTNGGAQLPPVKPLPLEEAKKRWGAGFKNNDKQF